jgi:hypothetical protein
MSMGRGLGGGGVACKRGVSQFYFHVIAAYAILRQQGVAIGKADYVPHMFGYLRASVVD